MLGRAGIALTLAAFPLAALAEGMPRAIHLGTFDWPDYKSWFGSFSGFDLAPDNVSFLIVSDLGYSVAGRFERDAEGRVVAVRDDVVVPLQPPPDLAVSNHMSDAEGLTFLPDGTFAVSFERADRIDVFTARDRPGESIPGLDIGGITWNKGFEALAARADGAIYAIPETSATTGGPFPVQVWRDGVWSTPFSIAAAGSWRPVGADFGPDGRLYLLERDFWGLVGFMSRVRRLTLDGDTVIEDVTLLETRAGVHENLEAIAVWQDDAGRIRLTMVSDDNVAAFQQTEVADYFVSE